MRHSFSQWLLEEVNSLLEIKKSDRLWHTPFLAAACMGLPLFAGYYMGSAGAGILASTGGLAILYLPAGSIVKKMYTLLACSLGFLLSFVLGLVFSFNPLFSAFMLSLFSVAANLVANRLEIRPPGSFLFITMMAIALCMPYDPHGIPEKAALVAAGSLCACLLTFVYLLLFSKQISKQAEEPPLYKSRRRVITESTMLGLFAGASLALGHLFHLQKPYWVPISCVAVMQGTDLRHVWQRGFQRFLGTITGLAVAWALLALHPGMLQVCIAITVLFFIADSFITRHYALVVVFFTPIAIFLAEAGSAMTANAAQLISARMFDTLLGCVIGSFGGFLLHNQLLPDSSKSSLDAS